MAGRIFVNTAPVRESREFRLLFFSQLVSTLGNQLTVVAIPYQVYSETHSSLQVGTVSLAQLIPFILGSLIGGSVGDVVDRRKLLVSTTAVLSLASAGLALNTVAARPSLLTLYLVSALSAGLSGFVNPARNAAVPALVDKQHLVAAFAFVQILYQVGSIVGPALSGLLIDVVGLAWVYGLDAITFVLAVGILVLMAPMPPTPGARRPGLGSIVEGFSFVRRNQVLQGIFLVDINAMVFGLPHALFPALSVHLFRGGPATLGLLYASPSSGALLGAVITGWVETVRRQGLAVIIAVVVWGTAITVFGLVHVLWLAMIMLAVAGWADVISAVLRNTILQTTIPDAFRSRLSSIQMAVVQGGPRLGDLEAGGVATATSTQFSVVSGGLACVAGAITLGWLLPRFRHYRVERPVEAPLEDDPGDDGLSAPN